METQELMDKLLQKESENRFKQPWSKLDKGTRLNRLHLYIKKEKIKNELNDTEEKQLKVILLQRFNGGGLTKLSEIEYCPEKMEIIEIKNLNYDEENKKYLFSPVIKKKKPEGSKSKSNIDRHFSRSKETKR